MENTQTSVEKWLQSSSNVAKMAEDRLSKLEMVIPWWPIWPMVQRAVNSPPLLLIKFPFGTIILQFFLYKTAIMNSLNAGFTTSFLFASNISLLVSTEPLQCMLFSRSNSITIGWIAMKLCGLTFLLHSWRIIQNLVILSLCAIIRSKVNLSFISNWNQKPLYSLHCFCC